MASTDPIPSLKQQVAAELTEFVDGWNADDAAAILGTDRPRISELRRGILTRFSLETLIRFAVRSGMRVHIDLVRARRGTRTN